MTQEKQRKPIRRGRVAILICAAVLALVGLRLNCLTGALSVYGNVGPEMLLCLGFVVCAGLSLIWRWFGALPFLGLTGYSAYMVLINPVTQYPVSAFVYLGLLLALCVILGFALSKGRWARFTFTAGGGLLAIFLVLSSVLNEGPYFQFLLNAEGAYTYASVLLSKALGAAALILATTVFVWARSLGDGAGKAVEEPVS
ncbi:MAG: hypothetical protein FWE69_04165 [Clostridiales bacterium]|nr:hypothetical protein [Clostridiales bacterium]